MRSIVRATTALAAIAACLPATTGTALAAHRTVCASGCRYTSIQAAIEAASPGATITIGPGSYDENLVVDKPLTLEGAGARTVVYPAVSNPICSPGSLCDGAASNIVLVEASDVTITKLTLDGANPALRSGVVRGGKEIAARNGIITDHEAGTFDDLRVTHVKVADIYLRGIYASSGGSFEFANDAVENVQGEEQSIAMFDFGGSGVFSHDKVTEANDAISANWSTGTRFLDNRITKSGSGVHTDNNGGSGGSADLIEGNRVSECTPGGYGIFVFVPYLSASVKDNRVTGCSVGLAAYGGAVSGQGPTFTDNRVDGSGAVATEGGTYGAYITTDQLGYEFGDVTATLTGNSIEDFGTGLLVTQSTPTDGDAAGGQATVSASGNAIAENGAGAIGEPGTTVSAASNWWGCPAGPNAGHCDSATGTVTFTPWLTAKP